MRAGRFASGWHGLALRIVRQQGLTIDALDALVVEAKQRSKGDPMDLVGTWVNPDGATWKDVLADRDYRVRQAEGLKRGRAAAALADRDMHRNGEPKPLPKLQIPPVYGEGDKTT
jgi:hypothetical protein